MNVNDSALFLSIDAGVSAYRACILDTSLSVVAVEQVDLDAELPEFGTTNGVHTLGDRVTAPSHLRIKALDLLLEKLATDTRHAELLPRVVAVSGAALPGVFHYLLAGFETSLDSLNLPANDRRMSEILTPASVFAVASPASVADSSAVSQVRQLEAHFGRVSLSSSSSPSSRDSSSTFSSTSGVSSTISFWYAPSTQPSTLSAGRRLFAAKTGSSLSSRSPAARLLQLREHDDTAIENCETRAGEGMLDRCERIVTESTMLSSIFVGRIAATEIADACSTDLFDLVERDWSDEILDFVARGRFEEGALDGDTSRVCEFKKKLGKIVRDGGKTLGTISPYLVKRFGFSPDTVVVPFTNTDAATFLSFPLRTTLGSPEDPPRRDALVSLSTDESDLLFIAAPDFSPGPDRRYFLHPARALDNKYGEDDVDGGERESEFVATISSRHGGLARALARDLYCNGSWDVFTRLVGIVPHGGTLGLDGKQFSLFFPHGEASLVQGFLRFVGGAKVSEFPDRKSNPRLLVEAQCLSLRIKLSQLYASLADADMLDDVRRHDLLGFPQRSKEFIPTRIVLVGRGAVNPAVTSILSTVFGAGAYLLSATGLKRARVDGEDLETSSSERCDEDGNNGNRFEASAAVLGAGYKAVWVYAREMERSDTSKPREERVATFTKFLEEKLCQSSRLDEDRSGQAQETAGSGQEKEQFCALPSSSSTLEPFPIPVTKRSEHRRSSSDSTVALSTPSQQAHSRNSSIYSSATSIFSSVPNYRATRSRPSGGNRGQPQQRMYNPEDDDLVQMKEIERDPAGLNLVAIPDEHEFGYYSSMMPEYARLEYYAAKGLI